MTFLTNMKPRTRALTVWAPLCIASAFAFSLNAGTINGGALISLGLVALTAYKMITGVER